MLNWTRTEPARDFTDSPHCKARNCACGNSLQHVGLVPSPIAGDLSYCICEFLYSNHLKWPPWLTHKSHFFGTLFVRYRVHETLPHPFVVFHSHTVFLTWRFDSLYCKRWGICVSPTALDRARRARTSGEILGTLWFSDWSLCESLLLKIVPLFQGINHWIQWGPWNLKNDLKNDTLDTHGCVTWHWLRHSRPKPCPSRLPFRTWVSWVHEVFSEFWFPNWKCQQFPNVNFVPEWEPSECNFWSLW